MLKRHEPSYESSVPSEDPFSEEALDEMIADSFPASDPPSFTPLKSLGEPAPHAETSRRRAFLVPAIVAAATIVAVAAAILGVRRARRPRPGRVPVALRRVRTAVGPLRERLAA